MSVEKRNESRVRCTCGQKMHREDALYPDTRMMELRDLIEKIGGRPIEPEDLDRFVMCRTCAGILRAMEFPKGSEFKGHAFNFEQTGKRVRQIEERVRQEAEELKTAVVCCECGDAVPEKRAYVPSFDLMKAKLGRMARLKDLAKVAVCPKCLGKKEAAEKAKFYPLPSTKAQMERDEAKRAEEQRVRSERAVRQRLGLEVEEAPAEHHEPAVKATLGEIAGVDVTLEIPAPDDEMGAEILSITPLTAVEPVTTAKPKPARTARRAKGEAKEATRRRRAVGAERDDE